jgi:hypothetical protein
MTPIFLRQHILARRWGISPRTLERWRWKGRGPTFTKIGGSVAYSLDDVLAYETAQRRVASGATIVRGVAR